jgi:hypothetical protein
MLSKRQRQGKRGNILLAMLSARPSMAFEFHPAQFENGCRQARVAAGGSLRYG